MRMPLAGAPSDSTISPEMGTFSGGGWDRFVAASAAVPSRNAADAGVSTGVASVGAVATASARNAGASPSTMESTAVFLRLANVMALMTPRAMARLANEAGFDVAIVPAGVDARS